MPTERFLHLPAEKRQRVTDAAKEEFSRVPYGEVSINRIVRAAGIARGSFYQYFGGKEDVLEYLIGDLKDTLFQTLDASIAANEGDMFAAATDMLRAALELGLRPENRGFYQHIFAATLPCGRHSFELMKMGAPALVEKYAAGINLAAFRSQSPADLAALVEMVALLMRSAVVWAFNGQGSSQAAVARFQGQLEILKHGVLRQAASSERGRVNV